jgi:tetratricopeptide (TPR) repeat protein
MNRHERRATARAAKKGSGSAGAAAADALYDAGLHHMQAGRSLDAQMDCRQALAIEPNHAGALHLMGLLSLQARSYDQAAEWMARAVAQDPKPEYLLSLAIALRHQGRRQEGLDALDTAIRIKPDDADPWQARGELLVELKRPADALQSFLHVLRLKPQHWDAANQSAVLLQQLGRPEEALAHLNLCDRLRPNHVATLNMRLACLHGLQRFEEALADARRVQGLDPASAHACNNVGSLLQTLGRAEQALPWFDQAIALRENFTEALHNKAVTLTQLQKLHEASAIYQHLKAANPGDALAELSLAHLHMLTGNFEAGWAGREARWRLPSHSTAYPKLAQPLWLGRESLAGKTILIAADEGYGDTIQFVRYVPMLAERGAGVVLVVQDSLHGLLSGLPGVAQCLPISATNTSPLPAFDVHCPLMSLPLAFATRLDTIPAPASYLPRPAAVRVQAWEDRLGRHDRLRVGLVWSGNPRHRNDQNRSLPLRALTRLLDVDATFVSLQKDPRPADQLALLERADIVDPTAQLTDFTETAALIACLDLVITVDTSVAHLSAALGRPTWILLPYTPDYRWLLDRDDSPWYPAARLFRQAATRDYASVLDRVRAELRAQVSAFEADRDQAGGSRALA